MNDLSRYYYRDANEGRRFPEASAW